MENWNDDRLDELSRRVDRGFAETATKEELTAVKDEMILRFGEVDRRLDEVTAGVRSLGERFDRQQNTLMLGVFGLMAAIAGTAIFG